MAFRPSPGLYAARIAAPLCILLCVAAIPARAQYGARGGEWRSYGGDSGSTRYSPLDQINAGNFKNLKLAWTWDSADIEVIRQNPQLHPGPNESTPLMVRGMLYTSTGLNQVAAIDAVTGKMKWVYNPGSNGGVHRGVAWWEKGGERRIFMTTRDSYLLALDPDTGKPISSFGDNGRIDLTKGLRRPVDRGFANQTSPPLVCNDVVVTGGAVDDFQDKREMPPGDVRGWDTRTGKPLWTFHSIPQKGEFGNETWERDSWKYTGAANVWSMMSCDPELGYVYLPFGTPNDDWYGGHRPGAGLFGESLVCLNAKTGKRVWHFQMVHHGLWDYDLPCAPVLLDVMIRGKRVKAVAQCTKQAFCFVFDRVTGKPLWPIEERPVSATSNPGDTASLTQPFPTKPAAYDRQNAVEENLIDFTPELREEAKKILDTWHHGPLYTPPSTTRTLMLPGWVGGASWAGASADPETGMLYVPSVTTPMWLQLKKPESPSATVDLMIGESGYKVEGPHGLPLFKPPYGRITAIDLSSGDRAWMAPLGPGPKDHPAIKRLNLPDLGVNRRGYIIVTKTLLIVAQEGSWFNEEAPLYPARLRAFDKATGRLLSEVPLPAHATGQPITYMAGGKQYVAIPIGGNYAPAALIAVALP